MLTPIYLAEILPGLMSTLGLYGTVTKVLRR